MLMLHQLTESKVQLNKSNVNNPKSNNFKWGDREAMTDRFCKLVGFELFPETKLWPKFLTLMVIQSIS